jgi:hypothetical protein
MNEDSDSRGDAFFGRPERPDRHPKIPRDGEKADGVSVEDFRRYVKETLAPNVAKNGYTGHLRGRGEEQWQRGAISGQ